VESEFLDFKTIVEAARDVIVVTEAFPLDGPEGPKIVYVNPAFTALTGYTLEEAVGQTPRILQRPASRESIDFAEMKRCLKAKHPFSGEVLNYAKDGTEYWLQLNIIPLKNTLGEVTHFAAIERDVTQQKKLEIELQALAKKDTLTGLVNRRGFDEILEERLKKLGQTDQVSLAMLDLDNFKEVNDCFGHLIGDQTLQHFAKLIKTHTRQHDIAARFGGDEFCIILNGASLNIAKRLMQRLSQAVDKQLQAPMDEPMQNITVSIGVVECKENETKESLISRADKALYRAKRRGKNTVETG